MAFIPGSPQSPLWLRATHWVDRLYCAFCAVRDELALAFVAHRRWQSIITDAYSRRADFYRDPDYRATGLFAWERDAIARHFPRPPARVLVGGAGAGREMLALADMGYQVAGLEPAPRLLDALREHLEDARVSAAVGLGSYEDLVAEMGAASVPAARGALAALWRGQAYDAIVLGFGSFSYCIDADTRIRLLKALARLCPRGPVLLSYESYAVTSGRLARLTTGLRGVLRHAPAAQALLPGDRLGDTGFEHAFSDDEIASLAAASGYRVVHLGQAPYPHAVLRPHSS